MIRSARKSACRRLPSLICGFLVPLFPIQIASANTDTPDSIEIWTVRELPVSVPVTWQRRVTVIHLDRMEDLETGLAHGVENLLEDRQREIVTGRLTAEIRSEMIRTWQVLELFAPYRPDRIVRLPAVVFDDRVVAHTTDLRQALAWYRKWRRSQ